MAERTKRALRRARAVYSQLAGSAEQHKGVGACLRIPLAGEEAQRFLVCEHVQPTNLPDVLKHPDTVQHDIDPHDGGSIRKRQALPSRQVTFR